MTTNIPIIFNINPAFIIVAIVNLPDPYTIAFGGVATGSIKAQLAASTVGIAKSKGFSPNPMAIDANMGKKVAVDAVLLVISVKNMIKVAIARLR